MFYNNTLGNALDFGINTLWNNSFIGNYWSGHSSTDNNRDGLCDTSYLVASGGNTDYLPISGNPIHPGKIIHIDDSGESGNGTWAWARTRWWIQGSGEFSDPYILENLILNGNVTFIVT